MRPLGHRIIHPDRSLVQFHSVALQFGLRGRTLLLEVHEPKPTGGLRLGIVDNHGLVDGAVRREHIHQVGFGGVATQPEHTKARALRRIHRTDRSRRRRTARRTGRRFADAAGAAYASVVMTTSPGRTVTMPTAAMSMLPTAAFTAVVLPVASRWSPATTARLSLRGRNLE